MSSALYTDHYELTMLEAALQSGVAEQPAVFELFARRLPPGRRYGVVAGLGRLVDCLDNFAFGDAELDLLSRFLDQRTCDWLSAYRFSGAIDAYPEGELYFPFSPVLTVEGTFAEAVVLETLALSILNHDSAVASAASRMRSAAADRTLIEMGGRRTHEEAAVAAARAAYLAGFDATSNLEAGRRYGIPTTGTAAHAFTLAHADEAAAFRAHVAAHGPGTTLLVDTFDIAQGIRTAVEVAGPKLGAVRIDSGDLDDEVSKARRLLDSLGAANTKIVVSGDLDEYAIEELGGCSVDAFGVGTKVVTGSGHPTANFVYKLVSIDGRPVAKRSAQKATVGARKWARRLLDGDGFATAERLRTSPFPEGGPPGRDLQVRVVQDGKVVHRPDLAEVRRFHQAALAELRADDRRPLAGPPVFTAEMEEAGA